MKYKFLTFFVLIVSVLFFYNVQDVNAMVSCTQGPPQWTPASVSWKNNTNPVTFELSQDYSEGWAESVGVLPYTYTSTCTTHTPSVNGEKCQSVGISSVEYQDFDPCPSLEQRLVYRSSPALKIDTVAPTCGTWSGSGPTFTLSGSTDTGNTGGDSGINVAGGTCTATAGNSCNVTISDVAGNTRVCTSFPWGAPLYDVNANAVNGYVDGPSSLQINSGNTVTFQFNTGTGNTPTFSTTCPTGPSGYDSVNGYWWYRTGAITSNCTVTATFPVTPALSCAHDTNQAEPIYPNAGAKFRATGGNGTYSWSYSATPAAGNATTGIEVWPAWTNSGTKTATVFSGGLSASCTVYITPAVNPMSGTLSASNCTIPLNGSSCNTNLSWTTTNPVGTSNVTSNTASPNTVVGNGNSGTATASVPATAASFPSRAFFLNNNGSVLAQATATASCTSGSAWNGTLCQSVATPINGVCATTHNNCTVGTSVDIVDNASFYLWNCNGSGGGTNASCSETKNVTPKPDLTATTPTPYTATTNVAQTYSSTIVNIGTGAAAGTITHSFQFDEDADHNFGVTSSTVTTSSTIPINNGQVPVSISHTFTTSGVKYVRVCADSGATVSELDENNNCSSWTGVTVANSVLPDLIASAPTPSTDVVINTPQRYTSTVTNQGTASTGASFSSFWQVATDWAGAGTVYDLLPTSSSSSLAASGTTPITYDMSFNGLGHKSMRACADKTSAASTGTIAESNETNNCSSWTNVTVTAAAAMTGTLTASNCTLVSGRCDTNLTWTTTNPEATSEVTTPTNIIVGTGLNNSATYTLTSAGDRIFYLYNNNKLLAQATATASESAPPSCTPTTSFSGSTTPASVSTGGEYFVACDFGVASGYIGASVGSGSCRFVDWSGKENTQANFNCTAGGIPGSFSNSCIISYNATYPYCTRTEAVNGLTVTSLPGGIINGLCSNPDNHLNPCSLGTPSTVVNGISSWTWSCNGSGVGHTDDTCVELKKKPKFEED